MNKVVYIFGPSCGGKSTLALTLKDNLDDTWTYIDRDDLVEQGVCDDSSADLVLEEKVLGCQERVIIDAQIPWREKRAGELYFLVIAPLERLLERDVERAEELQLNRTDRRVKYCRQFIRETHQILDKMEKEQFDYCFDSSKVSVEEEVRVIKTYLV